MIFDSDKEDAYYSPHADRIFIFKHATFLQLPCLERIDGKKIILSDPQEIKSLCDLDYFDNFKLIKLGEL